MKIIHIKAESALDSVKVESAIRFVPDIGMYAIDRSIPGSCAHATEFCRKECYNEKLYKLYPAMRGKDIKNEVYWAQLNGERFRREMARKRKGTNRFRFMTRGETFSNVSDVHKTSEIIKANPDIIFWIPTRAWHDIALKNLIDESIRSLPNARVLASLDPSDSEDDWVRVKAWGWSVMFFGDNTMTETPTGDRMFMCPKTHKKMNGHCAICKGGCFRQDKQVFVHLKQH